MAGPVTFAEEKLQEIVAVLGEIRDLLQSAPESVPDSEPTKPVANKASAKKTSSSKASS